jgi:hypothetical protein
MHCILHGRPRTSADSSFQRQIGTPDNRDSFPAGGLSPLKPIVVVNWPFVHQAGEREPWDLVDVNARCAEDLALRLAVGLHVLSTRLQARCSATRRMPLAAATSLDDCDFLCLVERSVIHRAGVSYTVRSPTISGLSQMRLSQLPMTRDRLDQPHTSHSLLPFAAHSYDTRQTRSAR